MSLTLPILLGVLLLSGPQEPDNAAVAERIRDEADAGVRGPRQVVDGEKSATITSVRSDFDREAKVVMFEENVRIEYAADYVMHADRLFVFMGGSNELSRIVALGHVAITNDTRVGTCAMAKFWRRTSEIEMFGDGDGTLAQMADESGDVLQGSRIRFWLDSEQVDVENTEIKVKKKDGGKFL